MATPFLKRKDQYPDPVILTETANGVINQDGIFFPFVTSINALPAVRGVRYYVKRINISWRGDGIIASGYTQVVGYIKGVPGQLVYQSHAAQTLATDFSNQDTVSDIGTLLDENSATSSTSTVGAHLLVITFAEVNIQV